MENRIKIGDEWYVKESSISAKENTTVLIEEDDILTGKYSMFENDMFCFEATHDLESGDLEMVVFTDKRNQRYPFTEKDTWDNEQWFLSVFKNVPNAFDEFDEGDTELIEATKAFISQVYNIFNNSCFAN